MNRPNVTESELRIVEAAARGDRDARRELFELYREVAYRVAMRITGRNEDALDVVQDSYIKAFDRLGNFAGQASFKTWFLRIVSNRALDLLRSRKVRLAVSLDNRRDEDAPAMTTLDEAAPSPDAGIEQSELADRLKSAIETLPVEQRTVFSMYAAGEMTYGDIAEALGIPIGTVMSRLYHARKRLHGILKDLAPGGSEMAEE